MERLVDHRIAPGADDDLTFPFLYRLDTFHARFKWPNCYAVDTRRFDGDFIRILFWIQCSADLVAAVPL